MVAGEGVRSVQDVHWVAYNYKLTNLPTRTMLILCIVCAVRIGMWCECDCESWDKKLPAHWSDVQMHILRHC